MSVDPEMDFEVAMRQWFGEAAWGIAGRVYNTSTRNKWLRKWITVLTKEVEQLDTDARHKDRMMALIGDLDASLRRADKAAWSQVFTLLELIGVVMGRLDAGGRRSRTLVYACEDYFHYLDAGETLPELGRIRDRPTILRARLEAINYLESKGLTLWRIAQVLNTSVHAIKRLRADLEHPKAEQDVPPNA